MISLALFRAASKLLSDNIQTVNISREAYLRNDDGPRVTSLNDRRSYESDQSLMRISYAGLYARSRTIFQSWSSSSSSWILRCASATISTLRAHIFCTHLHLELYVYVLGRMKWPRYIFIPKASNWSNDSREHKSISFRVSFHSRRYHRTTWSIASERKGITQNCDPRWSSSEKQISNKYKYLSFLPRPPLSPKSQNAAKRTRYRDPPASKVRWKQVVGANRRFVLNKHAPRPVPSGALGTDGDVIIIKINWDSLPSAEELRQLTSG